MTKFLSILLFAFWAGLACAQSIDDLNALNENIRLLGLELKAIEQERKGTAAAVNALRRKIAAERRALLLLAEQIERSDAKLVQLETDGRRIAAERQLYEHQARGVMLFLIDNSGNLAAKSVFGGLDIAGFAAISEATAHLDANLKKSIENFLIASKKLEDLQREVAEESAAMSIRLADRKRLTADWAASEADMARQLVLMRQDANAQKEYIAMLEAEAQSISDALKKATEAQIAAQGGSFTALKGRLPWPGKGSVAETFGEHLVPEAGISVRSNGIKLSLSSGEVQAVAAGTVVYADRAGSMQLVAIVRHDEEHYTVYGNLDALLVKSGDSLKMGDELGIINTALNGNSSYLYFEVREHQRPLNPADWLSK